jgi:Ni,Fe-hydrogenase I large subunit
MSILKNVTSVKRVIEKLSRVIVLFSGKFPIIMNFVPGGVTNPKLKVRNVLDALRDLEAVKIFIEDIYPKDVKTFIANTEYNLNYSEDSQNYLSFGSPIVLNTGRENQFYAQGVLIDSKLEPLNESKITTYNSQKGSELEGELSFLSSIGVHYDAEVMQTGALSRMMVTHSAGVNPLLSDALGEMIDILNLTEDTANQFSSRLLAEAFESRFLLKEAISRLLDFDFSGSLFNDESLDFENHKSGVGLIESPSGALLHKVYIENKKS